MKNVKVDVVVNVKMATLSAKFVRKNALNTSLKDLSIALNNKVGMAYFHF